MPRITTTRNLLNWPQDQDLSDYEIINRLNALAYDDNGDNITNNIQVDASHVNWHQQGSYSLYLYVNGEHGSDNKQIDVDVIPQRHPSRHDKKTDPKPKKKHKKKRGLITGLIIMALILAGVGLHSCMNQRAHDLAVESSQSSQIAQNSSSISSLQDKNQALNDQVNQLKNAVNDYQNDHDQQKLQNELDQIKAQNQNLKNQLSQQDYSNLEKTTEQIAKNPDQGNQYLNALENGDSNNPNANKGEQVLSWIHDQIENALNQ